MRRVRDRLRSSPCRPCPRRRAHRRWQARLRRSQTTPSSDCRSRPVARWQPKASPGRGRRRRSGWLRGDRPSCLLGTRPVWSRKIISPKVRRCINERISYPCTQMLVASDCVIADRHGSILSLLSAAGSPSKPSENSDDQASILTRNRGCLTVPIRLLRCLACLDGVSVRRS